MRGFMLSAETVITVNFYDLDPMNVVWHGNYPRFLEQGR
jgi:acyl-CoA thioester hydrolase